MKITNVKNLPESLCRALTFDAYDYENAGDISVTGAILPPRIRQLQRRHDKEITEDVTERIWKVLGDIGHGVVQRNAPPNTFSEERLSAIVNGWKLTGKVDLMRMEGDRYAIEDFKFTSVWAVKDAKPEWEQQLNFYAWLAGQNGFDVAQLRIIAILRDWSKPRAAREKDYPQVGVVIREVPLWPPDICERNLAAALTLHQQAQAIENDDDLPLCSEQERWTKPPVFAVKKKGRQRAIKLFADATEAAASMVGAKDLYIEERPGVDVRCVSYCPCKPFCSYGKALELGADEVAA